MQESRIIRRPRELAIAMRSENAKKLAESDRLLVIANEPRPQFTETVLLGGFRYSLSLYKRLV